MATYVDWKDLNKAQRMAVLAHVSEPVPEWLNGHAFRVLKNGTIGIPLWPRTAHGEARKKLAEMRREMTEGPPARPEKGDIHHLKTAQFALNWES